MHIYKLILMCLFFLFFKEINAQDKQVFKFIEINKKQAWDGGYIQRDFECFRFFYKNSIIEEVGVLPGSYSFFFKKKQGSWYVKNLKKWDIFYLPGRDLSPKIFSFDRWFTMKFEKYDMIGKIKCLIYTFQNDEYTTKQGDKSIIHLPVSDFPNTQYWFNNELGFVKIKSGDLEFVREDVIKN